MVSNILLFENVESTPGGKHGRSGGWQDCGVRCQRPSEMCTIGKNKRTGRVVCDKWGFLNEACGGAEVSFLQKEERAWRKPTANAAIMSLGNEKSADSAVPSCDKHNATVWFPACWGEKEKRKLKKKGRAFYRRNPPNVNQRLLARFGLDARSAHP